MAVPHWIEEPGVNDGSLFERIWMRLRVILVMVLSVLGGGCLNASFPDVEVD